VRAGLVAAYGSACFLAGKGATGVTGSGLRFHRRLGFQMSLAVALMTGLAFAATGWLVANHERTTLTRELTLRLLSDTRNLALAASPLLLRQDPELGLHPLILKAVAETPDLVDLVVLDPRGVILGHQQLLEVGKSAEVRPPARGRRIVAEDNGERAWIDGGEIVITRPIDHLGQRIGTLVARASRSGIEASVRDALLHVIWISVLGSLLTITLMLALLAHDLRPLGALRQGVQRIGAGDLSTRMRVSRRNELGMLADLINSMAEGLRLAQLETIRKERLDRELEIASDLQATLLPRDIASPAGTEIAAHYVPALEVSGDYYDVIPLRPDSLALVAADVSGKGVPGLVVMAMLRVILRGLSRPGHSPAEILAAANRMISGSMRRGMFVTCLYGIYDASTHRFRYTSAGHCPPAVYGGGMRARLLAAGGKAMGMFTPEVLEASLREHEVALQPGQGILLYTDGLTEARDAGDRQLGEDTVLAVLSQSAGRGASDVLRDITSRVTAHRAGRCSTDDLTLLLLQREFTTSGRRRSSSPHPQVVPA
jgi:serine phosphatase RsbU (regulator of sigma subunit)